MVQLRDQCDGLLRECHNNLSGHQRLRNCKPPPVVKLRLEQSTFGISLQEMEDNARIIDRLKRKYHRKKKEPTIKKTNLCQDQLTFSPQEYAKLQMIDECQDRGINYLKHFGEAVEVTEKGSAVERLKQLAKLDDLTEEVRSQLQWGQLPSTLALDLQMSKNSSVKKGGFQKREGSTSTLLGLNSNIGELQKSTVDCYKPSKSLNKYYFTLLNKKTMGRKQFLWTKNDSTLQSEELSLAEKLDFIREEAQRKTSKVCNSKSPFMTQKRKEAIFGCQILRQAKKLLRSSQLDGVQISIEATQGEREQACEEGQERRERHEESCEAEEILQKNYGRIRVQRKRVIEKMVC